MEIQQYLSQKKDIQKGLLSFIECEHEIEEKYINLINIIKDQKIQQDPQELQMFLSLLVNITNHKRTSNFYERLEKILFMFQNEIKQSFSNFQIFHIFRKNKRLLLFLLKEKIITVENKIADIMLTKKKFIKGHYSMYFYPELKTFLEPKIQKEIENKIQEIEQKSSATFEELRKRGENEELISQLIREDSIENFIIYANRVRFSFSLKLESSIFETNYSLLHKPTSLIEYAAFFGSFQILKFLFHNQAECSPQLWLFAVHGNNREIIQFLKENKIEQYNGTYKYCLNESIKCHHLEMANFIQVYLLDENFQMDYSIYSNVFKFINFCYFPNQLNDIFSFFYLCKYNYCTLVDILLKTTKIDINDSIIFI